MAGFAVGRSMILDSALLVRRVQWLAHRMP